jgi:OmpA-OmpF porin, OOP family
MKTTKTVLLAFLMGAGLLSAPAMAAGPFYGGASIGQSKFTNPCSSFSRGCDDSDTSFKIFGGYTYNANISGEVGYLDFGKAKVNINGTNVNLSGNALYCDAVGNYPLGSNFSLLGRVGFANATGKASVGIASASDSEVKLHLGIGAVYEISPTLSLRGEWEQVSDFASALSAGLAVKF